MTGVNVFETDHETVVLPEAVVKYALTRTKNASDKSLNDRRTRAFKFIEKYANSSDLERIIIEHRVNHIDDIATAIMFGIMPE